MQPTMDYTIQNKQNMDAICLDFRKAFDSVSHVQLMNKLSACGLGNNARGWLRNFLNSRTQRVAINGFISDEIPVEFLRVVF